MIPVTVQFTVRYVLRTGLLGRLTDFADPVVLLNWDDPALAREFEDAGAEVHRLPPARAGARYDRVRAALKVWHRARLGSPSAAIDARRNEATLSPLGRLTRRAREVARRAEVSLPGRVAALRRAENRLLHEDTNLGEVAAALDEIRPDAVLGMTPFQREEEFVVRACQHRGLPSFASILSFDNLTTRGWIAPVFDAYLLWNRYNQEELRRGYPEADGRPVTLVGPPQFDFYRDPSYVWDERTWRERLGLPEGRPVILFGAGPREIVPHEPGLAAQVDRAVTSGEIPGNPILLVRIHPNDAEGRWESLRREARNVVFDSPWRCGVVPAHANVRRDDIEKLASTLHHSRVHVNTSSTMTVDGAAFDRPQVGPAYDDRPGRPFDRVARELYLREHYLPITHSGGLALATSRETMVAEIGSALDDPSARAGGRRRLVSEICTYTDGRCAERVAQAVARLLGRKTGPDALDRRAPDHDDRVSAGSHTLTPRESR